MRTSAILRVGVAISKTCLAFTPGHAHAHAGELCRLANILRGARAEEKAKEEAKAQKARDVTGSRP